MAYGNNRAGEQPRAHFQLAGGTTIRFKHPYLAGQLDAKHDIDEIDVSACCKLEGRFFEANPNQDSAKQVVLIDGSVATITNRLLNGTLTMPIVRTTGQVATGDFISALQLIKSVGDTVGGILYKTDFINGKAITKLYYGVTPMRVPDDVAEGNDVAVYNISLLYAGWIEVSSASTEINKKAIWATGTEKGINGYFSPYAGQNGDGKSGTGSTYMQSASFGAGNVPSDDKSGDTAGTTLEKDKMYQSTATAVDKGGTVNVTGVGDTLEIK